MLKYIFRFEKEKYLHSGKIILPLILLCGYLGFAYSISPQKILDSFSLNALIIFLLMLAVGVMYDSANSPMIEMSIIVKLKRKELLHLGKAMVIAYVSLMFTLISLTIPVLSHIANHMALFDRQIVLTDILSGAILFFLVSMCGGMLGLFANHRILNNRGVIVGLSAMAGLASITKVSLNQDFFLTKFITWILPPVNDISIAYCSGLYFSLQNTAVYFLWLLLYTAALLVTYVKVMVHLGYA